MTIYVNTLPVSEKSSGIRTFLLELLHAFAESNNPSAGLSLSILLLPIMLILVGSIISLIIGKTHALYPLVTFLGDKNIALLIGVISAMVFLRPYIIRDSGAGRSITLNRYEFMRRAQSGLQPEHSWAMPDVQAPQLPSVEKAIPGGQQPGP